MVSYTTACNLTIKLFGVFDSRIVDNLLYKTSTSTYHGFNTHQLLALLAFIIGKKCESCLIVSFKQNNSCPWPAVSERV